MAKSKNSKPPKGFKQLQCKYCDNVSNRVDEKATSITCSVCVQRMTEGKILDPRKK